MSVPVGTRLGPYEVLAPVGAGGMGEVYRASDTRLNRTVAIKVLREHLAARPDLKQRLEREARIISSLNHPHICTLHDIGNHNGNDFLVMEYLDGETLARRVERGALDLPEALQYAIQIADALDCAHRQGVVHRDLKPANVMLTRSGAKLLDFGLAGSVLRAKAAATDTGDTTPVAPRGFIVGTFQYIAPEQLEGSEPDCRSDIFSFGAVLYEMVTGRRAFQGRSQAAVISAVMTAAPESASAIAPRTPPAVDRLLRSCLAKDPDQRWQTAYDLKLELQWSLDCLAGTEAGPAPAASTSRRLPWVVAALCAIALIASLVFRTGWTRRSIQQTRPLRFALSLPADARLEPVNSPVISPDGRHVAFTIHVAGHRGIWIRSLDQVSPRLLEGTEGAFGLFWSADSQQIGFFSGTRLRKVPLSSGSPHDIADAPAGRGGAWSREGIIVFCPRERELHAVPDTGGPSRPVTTLDRSREEEAHGFPFFLPDGRHFLYNARSSRLENNAIFVGSLDGQRPRLVLNSDSSALYSPPGYLLFTRDEALNAMRFDWKSQRASGEPIVLEDRVARSVAIGWSMFSVSEDGTLAYRLGSGNDGQYELNWYGRDGKAQAAGVAGAFRQMSLSPDGKRVVVERNDPKDGKWDLWLLELSSGIFSRLTFTGSSEEDAVWSPDSRRIVYSSNRGGNYDLYEKVIGGEGETLLYASGGDSVAEDWLADGRVLFFPRDGKAIYALATTGPQREAKLLLNTPVEKDEARVSPDGRWIAFASQESGRWETYIARFPEFTEKRQVSSAGGGQPLWRRDGSELYYMDPHGNIMAVQLAARGPALQPSMPQLVVKTRSRSAPREDRYAVTADGQRFLVVEARQENLPPFHVILNWTALLRQ